MRRERKTAQAVPTYALYGEQTYNAATDWLHCESIPARSALFDWEIGAHRHAGLFQILNMTRGRAECLLGERWLPLPPPVAVLVMPGVTHGFRFSPDTEGHVITLLAGQALQMPQAAPELRPLLAQSRILPLPDWAALPVAQAVAAIALDYAGSSPGRLGFIEAQLTVLLITLGRVLAADAEAGRPNRHAAQFRMLLDQHFRSQRGLAFYAGRLGISDVHLNRVCRAALGCSALGAINQRLIAEARRDLTFTLLSVKEIAYSLGFDDPAYFTRFFTKQAGVTPTEFRRRSARHPDRG